MVSAVKGYPKGAIHCPGMGRSLTVLAQYASVATPCRMRRIDPLGAHRIYELKLFSFRWGVVKWHHTWL